MSRTKKDMSHRVTGVWTHRYYVSPKGHAKFTKMCRRIVRRRQKLDLKRYGELMPDYPQGTSTLTSLGCANGSLHHG